MGHILDNNIYQSEEIKALGDAVYALGTFVELAEVLGEKRGKDEISQEDFDARFPTLLAAIGASAQQIKQQINDVGLGS